MRLAPARNTWKACGTTASRLFRLAWDFAGSALAGRNDFYERFCLASAPRNHGLNHVIAQREREWTAVPELLVGSGNERE